MDLKMPQYLILAEDIIAKINSTQEFTEDPLTNVNLIIRKLRKDIKKTKLILKCNYIDLNDYYQSNEQNLQISLDFTMMPKDYTSIDFLLWVANFIEKITYDKFKKNNYEKERKEILNKFFSRIDRKNEEIRKLLIDETCEDINKYFLDNCSKKIKVKESTYSWGDISTQENPKT